MEFVLALHSHLPYVLNHGRWPHGSDWLCEAALDTYLPLLERLEELAAEGTPTPLTIGFTPVLANQLASPAFAGELEAFFAQRLAACDEAPPVRQVARGRSAARHRAAPRGRGVWLLLRRRASRARGQPARRLRRDSARRGAVRRGTARPGVPGGGSSAGCALALSGLPRLWSRCAPRGRGAGARPPLFHADLEPAPGLPRRRVVPRVSQDPLARRLEALARHRSERGPGRQTSVRAVGGARAGNGACLPLRSSPPEPGAAAGRPGRGRHHRGAIRYGAVRALVVRGCRFPGRDVPRAARLRQGRCPRGDRVAAPRGSRRQHGAAAGRGFLGSERRP